MYIRYSEDVWKRHSEDILDILWTSYLCSIYVLCPGCRLPLEILNGGNNSVLIVSSTSKNGCSPNMKVYNVTPNDHISNSGP